MDRKQALETATMWTANTWARLEKMYPLMLGKCPSVEISARLKTTAGFCYWEQRQTKYSFDLFCEYAETFRMVTIPHELAHQVAWDVYRVPQRRAHGTEWKSIMERLGLEPTPWHDMVNTKYAASRAKVVL